jgi:hypothetical protein
MLSGEDVLPGFVLDLTGILFDRLTRVRSVKNAPHSTETLLG